MKDLVLDLQGNGGGYLNAAIDLAKWILEKELIVYTEGRRNPRSEFFAKGYRRFQDGRLIVLVDEFRLLPVKSWPELFRTGTEE